MIPCPKRHRIFTMPSPTKTVTETSFPARVDRYFKISERRSTFATEVRGGIATFFAMSYIVVLNPSGALRRRLFRW